MQSCGSIVRKTTLNKPLVRPIKKEGQPPSCKLPFFNASAKRFQTAKRVTPRKIILPLPVSSGVFSPPRYYRQLFRQRCGQSRRKQARQP